MALILENDDYLDAQNANFCGGIQYACEQILEYCEKKRTVNDIKKYVEYLLDESIETRKMFSINKKSKVSVLK